MILFGDINKGLFTRRSTRKFEHALEHFVSSREIHQWS